MDSDEYRDVVERPKHYLIDGGFEVIDILKGLSSNEGYRSHLYLTAVAYIMRCMKKGTPIADLHKAKWYIDKLIEEIEG